MHNTTTVLFNYSKVFFSQIQPLIMNRKIKPFLFAGILLSATLIQNVSAQNSSPYWSLAGNSNASAGSKLGTTTATPLVLFTNNSERLRIQSNGRVGINTANPLNLLMVQVNGSSPAGAWIPNSPVFTGYAEGQTTQLDLGSATNTADLRPVFAGKRSRGTLSSPSIVQNNDYITSIIASAYDGGTFLSPAAINFYVDGSTSGGSVPARISFETGRNRSTRQERLKILNNGDFDFNDGQLFLEKSTGRIGIGTSALAAKLDILNTDNFYGINVINSFTGNVDRVGLSAYSVTNPGYGYGVVATGGFHGVEGVGSGSSYPGGVYGIYGYADGTAGSRYGVYGYSYGGTFNAAGYFQGDVWAVTYNNISDRKFKIDIVPLENSLQQLMNLQPKSYLFKKEGNAKRALPSGKQIGLIADEVKQVFPELVKEAVQPAEYGKDRSEVIAPEVKYESVNYIGLIPVLIASIQEQQKSIEDQKKLAAQQQIQIDELKELVKKLSLGKDITNVLTNASIEQNNPNPLDKFTTIRYALPQNSKSASLLVRDMNGKTIRQVQLGNSLQGNVNFDATGLAAGNYTYSILVDGKLASTKIMTVAK